LLLVLAGCGRQPETTRSSPPVAGKALERAAIAAGVVADPASIDPVGAYAADTDRVCIVRADAGYRIGIAVDYGDEQGCVARGTARGGQRLAVTLGGDCRFEAQADGQRITVPATLPASCDRAFCTGRATLTAVIADRLSATEAEARAMRAPDGHNLCGS
jgi:hypothetical protein